MKTQRLRSKLLPLLLLLTLAAAAHSATRAVPNPVPLVNNPLVPDAVAPGSQGFTLTVNGTGFVAGSVVNWDGSPLATTFVNTSQVTAVVPAANVAAPGTAAITVVNPGPGGGGSNMDLFSVRASFTGASFGPTDFATVSGGAILPVSADFNADGKPDLAVIAPENSAVAVLQNPGNGLFQSAVEYPVGNSSEGLIAGDFNADGKLDLAISDHDGFVSILLGNGDGTFQPRKDSPSAVFALDLAAGDFNGDGRLDLAVAIANPVAEVVILLGSGDGTFQSPAFYVVGSTRASSLTVGDFDRDGNLDLAVAVFSDNAVSILGGNGDGTFQSAIEYSTQFGPYSVVAADTNPVCLRSLVEETGHSRCAVILLLVKNLSASPSLILTGTADST